MALGNQWKHMPMGGQFQFKYKRMVIIISRDYGSEEYQSYGSNYYLQNYRKDYDEIIKNVKAQKNNMGYNVKPVPFFPLSDLCLTNSSTLLMLYPGRCPQPINMVLWHIYTYDSNHLIMYGFTILHTAGLDTRKDTLRTNTLQRYC